MNARAMLSLLLHGDKALDVVRTARKIGMIPILDAGPVTLRELADATGTRPRFGCTNFSMFLRTSVGSRMSASDDLMAARFVSREPIAGVVEAVLGEDSIELDRDRYPWQEILGRLDEVLCGKTPCAFLVS